MSEARSVEEAARSIRVALYELQRQPNWTGGATRAEITSYCLAQKLPTPERFFDAAIEEVDADKTTTGGYHPSIPDVRYALTREGRAEAEDERRDLHVSGAGEPTVPTLAIAQIDPKRSRAIPMPIAQAASLAADPEPAGTARSFADALPRWNKVPETLKLVAAFGLGTLTGIVLASLRW